jgi:hypothetical protein
MTPKWKAAYDGFGKYEISEDVPGGRLIAETVYCPEHLGPKALMNAGINAEMFAQARETGAERDGLRELIAEFVRHAHGVLEEMKVEGIDQYYAADRLRETISKAIRPQMEAETPTDSARLDFIEEHARCDPKMDGNHTWWPTSFGDRLSGPTLRAAIDAKIRSYGDTE